MIFPAVFKKNHTLFLLVFLANMCFRLIGVSRHSLWFDECLWIDIGEWDIPKILDFCRTRDPNPPLYAIIIHYWTLLFGDSVFAIRLMPALASSLAGAFLFLMCRRFFNLQTAMFASIFYFASNELFYYAQEARPYALIILFSVLSNYFFLDLMQAPRLWKALILGIFNCILFYLHILSAFCFLGQALLFLIIAPDVVRIRSAQGVLTLDYRLRWRTVLYYCISWLAFLALFYPWSSRFMELMKEGGTNFWLAKPTLSELGQCAYDFFNSKVLFILFSGGCLAVTVLLFFKRFRSGPVSFKFLLFAALSGPGILLLNYWIASFSPIFLKRYVLFTITGFFVLYAYIFSLLNVRADLKLIVFVILGAISFSQIRIPRETVMDYQNGVTFLKKAQTGQTLIVNDLTELFTYYYDHDKAWKMKVPQERLNYLRVSKHVVFPDKPNWFLDIDYTKYTDIYYSSSFWGYRDPAQEEEKFFRANFIFVREITDFKGIKLLQFKNPNFKAG